MKVVLMSGHACELHVFRAGWQFLLKPFTPGTLVSTVEEALGWRLRPKLVA
jgi:FixJ family two-component response regulator